MEAGYDYLLLRGRRQRRLLGIAALFLVCLGGLLLAGGGAFYGFAAKARADLASLNASLPPVADTWSMHQDAPDAGSALVRPSGISAAGIANQDLRIGNSIDAKDRCSSTCPRSPRN